MLSILFLPRQFQIAVVENVNENHLRKAIWLFPLYLLLINLFVLPIALGGLLHFPAGTVDADTFVLTLPMAAAAGTGWRCSSSSAGSRRHRHGHRRDHRPVHHGLQRSGDAAAAAPALGCACSERSDLSGLLLAIRRGAIVAHPAAGLRLLPRWPARPTRWSPSASSPSPRWRSSRRRSSAACTGAAARRGGASPALQRRLRGLDLHPAAAVLRQVGLAAADLPRARAVRHRAAQAAAAVRPGRAGRDHPLPVLEHARQYRLLRRRLAGAPRRRARRPARRPCSSTSSSTARRAPARSFWRGSAQSPICWRWSGAFSGRSARARRSRAYARQRGARPASRICPRMPVWCTSPRRCWPAPSAAPRRG